MVPRGSEFDQTRTDGVASSACPQRCIRASDREKGVLELVDLACVKINKHKPRQLSLIMYRPQSTSVSITDIHSPAPSRFSDVAGVAALRRPRLMLFLTMVPQSRPHPFCKRGKAIAVPLLQRFTAERLTGAVALISQNSDLVHQVGMLRPARWDDIGDRRTLTPVPCPERAPSTAAAAEADPRVQRLCCTRKRASGAGVAACPGRQRLFGFALERHCCHFGA